MQLTLTITMSTGFSFSSKSIQTLFFNEATGHVYKRFFVDETINLAATIKYIFQPEWSFLLSLDIQGSLHCKQSNLY